MNRELHAFYEELDEAIYNEKYFYKFVVGDINARMAEEAEYRIGRFGFGLRKGKGNRLVGLHSANRLFLGFSIFLKTV